MSNRGMTLQQTFITNIKAIRKKRGLSQMALSELCDTTSNYIGQIEMGRRIPSFEKIEKIAAALQIPCHELFMGEDKEEQAEQTIQRYLQELPQNIKKEIVSHLTAAISKEIQSSLDPKNW